MLSAIYKKIFRPILFMQDPEVVHSLTVRGLQLVSKFSILCGMMKSLYGAESLPVQAFGLNFPNPLGLAAGMDKQGIALRAWEAMGFGFSELGAVTRYEQPGNPAPRVFRAIPDEAIINRMGFNNSGAKKMAETLKTARESGCYPKHPIGINLGKSKKTPLEESPEDYAYSLEALKDLADFFVVNVSCPNIPNLRSLQNKDSLKAIFSALQKINHKGNNPKPILLKLSPDLPMEAVDEILQLYPKLGASGIVATNTTVMRPNGTTPKLQKIYAEKGGLSGKPLRQKSTEMIANIYCRTGGNVPIIGVGGIFTVEDAWEKITHGATLLQMFTGLVYEGPTAPSQIVAGLKKRLQDNGFSKIEDAVGSAIK